RDRQGVRLLMRSSARNLTSPHLRPEPGPRSTAVRAGERGFTLLEALVAIAILAISLLGLCAIRTEAVISATRTRNLRLARELAERTLTQIEAGTMEFLESGIERPFERYPKF